MRRLLLPLLVLALACPASARAAAPQHLFVIVLENEDAATTFGPGSPAPYLASTLRAQGAFVPNYYGIGHNSLDNYLAMVSGQAPTTQTQADCPLFADVLPGLPAPDGQVIGQGCVYPASVRTVADQLEARGLTWKGYMEDMGDDPARDNGTTCAHPALGTPDGTQQASATDQYATRHNPFVYFHSIIDRPACAQRDVPLSAGLPAADAFLRTWVPRITSSPAYRRDGALAIVFDEAESDASACCGELPGPNTPLPGIQGPGGGRTGAVVLSPAIPPGTTTTQAFNHYSLLAAIEDAFGLPRLGYAARATVLPTG